MPPWAKESFCTEVAGGRAEGREVEERGGPFRRTGREWLVVHVCSVE